jgi:hypothetical protein
MTQQTKILFTLACFIAGPLICEAWIRNYAYDHPRYMERLAKKRPRDLFPTEIHQCKGSTCQVIDRHPTYPFTLTYDCGIDPCR